MMQLKNGIIELKVNKFCVLAILLTILNYNICFSQETTMRWLSDFYYYESNLLTINNCCKTKKISNDNYKIKGLFVKKDSTIIVYDFFNKNITNTFYSLKNLVYINKEKDTLSLKMLKNDIIKIYDFNSKKNIYFHLLKHPKTKTINFDYNLFNQMLKVKNRKLLLNAFYIKFNKNNTGFLYSKELKVMFKINWDIKNVFGINYLTVAIDNPYDYPSLIFDNNYIFIIIITKINKKKIIGKLWSEYNLGLADF